MVKVTCRSPNADLLDGTDAEQGIAALERVVEEGEGRSRCRVMSQRENLAISRPSD